MKEIPSLTLPLDITTSNITQGSRYSVTLDSNDVGKESYTLCKTGMIYIRVTLDGVAYLGA